MKNRMEKLELQMNSMKIENNAKLKDMCRMLIQSKLEIFRFQEIIWALHPNVDLNSDFIVDNDCILEALSGIVNTCDEESGFESVTSEH